MTNSHEKLSDSELYKLAQEYGLRAKQWMRKFEGLLPEIYRRRLYKKRGCASIHEFAAKLAGMNHEKTDGILRLSKCLEDKPALREILEFGKASYSKIEKVAYVATPETEAAWAEKVLKIPQQALEICVQEARKINRSEVTLKDNFQPEKNTDPQLILESANTQPAPEKSPQDEYNYISFKISPELEYEFRLLKQKLEKERGEALGFAEVLQELMKAYKNAGQSGVKMPEKKRVIQLCPKCIKEKANVMAEFSEPAHTIPAEVRHLVMARQQNKCAFPNCKNPPEIFHHTRRFALMRNHDPDHVVHLCAPHEKLAHAGFVANEEQNAALWHVSSDPTYRDKAKFRIDEKVNTFRRSEAYQ
jgi:hypothetical protein